MNHQNVSRRSILAAAGTGGIGLAAGAVAVGQVMAYRRGPLRADELDRLPRVAESIRPTDRPALGRDGALGVPTEPAPATRLVEMVASPGEELEDLGIAVRQHAAEYVCDPRRPNLLLAGASRVAYEIVEVAWQPGEGCPLYRTRAPHGAPAYGTRYAGVPRHQIVLLDDRAIYVGNPGTAGIIEDIQGPLRVDVNGDADAFEGHRGYYKVLITGIA